MLIAHPQTAALTVGEYAAQLRRALAGVGGAVVEGEVQKVSRTQRGMIYFELTDGEALLSCKAFARDAARFERPPRAGDLVQVQVDRPDFYVARGSVSLIVSGLRLAGEGELLRRRAELLERLRAEGLCDPGRRRRLPRFPRAVGVIAGEGSDGMSDVVRALTDRWPAVTIITCASLVQGKAAPSQLIDALARLQEHPSVDAIVLARGGGSVADLACFDDERVCRAVFACAKPVICAIGHTDNNPVCNHVAWHASTPSRSAELAVPSVAEVRREIATAGDCLSRVPSRLEARSKAIGIQLLHVRGDDVLTRQRQNLAFHAVALARVWERIVTLASDVRQRAAFSEPVGRRLQDARRETTHRAELIGASDFRRRGWIMASTRDGSAAASLAGLNLGQRLSLTLSDGQADVRVERIHPDLRNDP